MTTIPTTDYIRDLQTTVDDYGLHLEHHLSQVRDRARDATTASGSV